MLYSENCCKAITYEREMPEHLITMLKIFNRTTELQFSLRDLFENISTSADLYPHLNSENDSSNDPSLEKLDRHVPQVDSVFSFSKVTVPVYTHSDLC